MTNTATLFVGGYTPNNDFFINGRYFVGFGATVRSNGAGSSLEANVQRATTVSCTLQNIGCQVVLSNTGANTTGWWSRVGAADGNQTAVLTSSVTGYIQDTTHTDSLTATTSLFNAAFKGVSAGPDCEITSHNVVIVNTSPLAEFAWSPQANINANGLTFSTNANHFLHIMGGSGASTDTSETSESNATKMLVRAAGTYKGLQAILTTNTSGSTIKFRVNGANGNQTISPGTTSSAALTQDTTHTDAVVSGDRVNYVLNPNASATMTTTYLGGSFAGTTSAQDVFATAGTTLSNANTFMAVGGSWGSNTTESQSQIKCHTAVTWDRLRVRLTSNSLSTNQTFISRNATADGNQTVTLTAGSGAADLEDTTHTDSVSADALVNYKYPVSGSPTGSAIVAWYGGKFNDGTNTGSSTETGTATMAFSGISFVASGARQETSTGAMAFAGISFSGSGARTETGTAGMAFTKASFVGTGLVIKVKGTAGMAFAGISIQASGLVLGPAGSGLRQFSTFG